MDIIIIGITAIVSLGLGILIGRILLARIFQKQKSNAIRKAKKIIKDAELNAENIKRSKLLESKEKFLERKVNFDAMVSKHNKRMDERNKSIRDKEIAIKQEKEILSKGKEELDLLKGNLNQQLDLVKMKKAELDKNQEEHRKKLETIAHITAEEAKQQLIKSMEADARSASVARIKEIVDEAKMTASRDAKKILVQTIQRTAAEQAIENTISVFNLESDDQKGQIIGREGRNIRALEAATGVEIVVDDTPEAIIISGFDPVRREIARLSLQRLVADGRIHPARIEEVVNKTRKQLENQIVEIGERTVIELGVNNLHPELIRHIGRMRFRSSYGQNLLKHSKETAQMCAIMAAEMGLKPKLAKRAGLLHDIGKVSEEDPEKSHALLGMELCKKYGEHEAICNAVGAHHDEIEMKYAISAVVQACDAISGSRPGARRESLQSYIQRIKELETIAIGYEGVQKAYAMQAGRELRVIVESENVSDQASEELSFKISEHIHNEMTYPGQIKVTVIREMRSIAYAK